MQHRIMKTTRNVLESNYCNVLSQKHRQVLKPLAGITLLVLISFDVISHHKELNPSHMINWAIAKIGCMAKNVHNGCHQIKYPHHLWDERLRFCMAFSQGMVKRGISEPAGTLLRPRQVAITSISVSFQGPGTAAESCFQTAGDTFQLWEIKSGLTEGDW